MNDVALFGRGGLRQAGACADVDRGSQEVPASLTLGMLYPVTEDGRNAAKHERPAVAAWNDVALSGRRGLWQADA